MSDFGEKRDDADYVKAVDELLNPVRVYSRDEVAVRDSVVPSRPGVYAWYFDQALPGVLTEGCRVGDAGTLLYVGIAPKAPPANGKPPSRQHLRQRIRYHFRGNAFGSTLRLSLGCHLTEQLDIELRRVGRSGTRLTFTKLGEDMLSEWMAAHARVAFTVHDEPWKLEHALISKEIFPLNISHNIRSPYYATLRALRAEHKRRARALPVA
ncbi:GIY-YIG nuclease family protein [Kutzneria albida]|uniref:GIY-YIG catalytic domain-containing protein n=1 Tax=Kutzneria albida DSM 43870 TaxID=1449976 RepID=W5WAK0_9PSEU|nr:hypothetical protein [Kutzneria albida]AHH97586.1 hypothetical protein KALB_4223 [Kutzneria albida DSM 43870]